MTINNMVSGVQYDLPLKLSLVDYDGQVMVLNNINQIIINPINKTSISMKGTSTALLRGGVATFSNLVVNARPGSQDVQLQASSKSINSLKVKEIYGILNSNLISANFRYCKPGEIQQNDNTCSV